MKIRIHLIGSQRRRNFGTLAFLFGLATKLCFGCSDSSTSGLAEGDGATGPIDAATGSDFDGFGGDSSAEGSGDESSAEGQVSDGSDAEDEHTDSNGTPDAACSEGALGCFSDKQASICKSGVWQFLTTCGREAVCKEGVCITPAECTPGEVLGCDGLSYRKVCTPTGDGVANVLCEGELKCIAGECVNALCVPGVARCTSTASYEVCSSDGQSFESEQACPADTTCLGGKCLSLCEGDIKLNTNVGCEYWSVDLNNDPVKHPLFPSQPTPEMFPHSVVISNPNAQPTSVSFTVHVTCANGDNCTPGIQTCGAQSTVCETESANTNDLFFADSVVPAGESREFKMPVMNVSGSGIWKKAIRVVASLPVVAYQFNPFDSENAASNDGSLLLPRNSLGKEYFAVSLPSRAEIPGLGGGAPLFPANNGFVTVVATASDTTVEVTPSVQVFANPAAGVPQDGSQPATLSAGQTYTFVLQPFEVLNLEQKATLSIVPANTYSPDLTGTRVLADKPIAVFSGHQVVGVQELSKSVVNSGWDSCCNEHLEEQLMPVETWGSSALCVKSSPRGQEADSWIVVAGDDGITLATTPNIVGLNGKFLAKAGDHVRVDTKQSFNLSANGRIQVVQLLVGQGNTQPEGGPPGTGDPTMMIVPPTAQYRNEYVIRTADGFGTNWLTVIRAPGQTVWLDDQLLLPGLFSTFGDGAWERAYVQVQKGTHVLKSDNEFGLMVYGYGSVTAYGYPGGMKLAQ